MRDAGFAVRNRGPGISRFRTLELQNKTGGRKSQIPKIKLTLPVRHKSRTAQRNYDTAKFGPKNPRPQVKRKRNKGRRRMLNGLIVVGLLVLPIVAVQQRGFDLRLVAGYVAVVGLLTYAVYASDKRRAEAGGWRVPEATLHLLEIVGGWPAAFLAQRWLRHKSSKKSYQVKFWLIVVLYQLIAFDSLEGWRFSRMVKDCFVR